MPYRARRRIAGIDLSAPEILHADLDRGLILIEDLGDERIVSGSPPTPLKRDTRPLSIFWLRSHARNLPNRLPVTSALDYRLPRYDIGAFLIEAELLLDWYLVNAGAPVGEAPHS